MGGWCRMNFCCWWWWCCCFVVSVIIVGVIVAVVAVVVIVSPVLLSGVGSLVAVDIPARLEKLKKILHPQKLCFSRSESCEPKQRIACILLLLLPATHAAS